MYWYFQCVVGYHSKYLLIETGSFSNHGDRTRVTASAVSTPVLGQINIITVPNLKTFILR